MPKPQEVATITVNGQKYTSWKTVSVSRSYLHGGSVAEVSILELGLDQGRAQRIEVGQPAQVLLGSVLVLDGVIEMRQASYNAEQHGLMIRIVSNTILTVKSSVSTKPGQFKNQSISQIANAVLSPVGVSFGYDRRGHPPTPRRSSSAYRSTSARPCMAPWLGLPACATCSCATTRTATSSRPGFRAATKSWLS